MKRSACSIFTISLALIIFSITLSSASTQASAAVKGEMNARYAEAYGKLPLSFVENKGQLNKAVRYVINGPRASAFFTNTGVTFDLAEAQPKKPKSPRDLDPVSLTAVKPVKHVALKMEFAGVSSKCKVTGVDKLSGKVNIIKGKDSSKWKTDIPTYKGIIYKDAWKGIDVSYSGNRKQLKYDIIVNPGAKVSDIKLMYSGADKIWLDAKGDLHIKTAVASFTETVPGIHQTKSGRQTALKGGYILLDKQTVGFKVHGADPRIPIVIDPASDLVYSTFLGGNDGDIGTGIAVDNNGCAYIAGYSDSLDFPTTPGAYYDDKYFQVYQAFVTKLNPSGTALEYSTLISGCSYYSGQQLQIVVDGEGCAYIAGYTIPYEFVTTPGAFDETHNNSYDSFVLKLNPTGTALVYSTLLGGRDYDGITGIALDSQGCVYVSGETWSLDFPAISGIFNSNAINYKAIFVTKFNASGSALEYSTLLGGSSMEFSHAIAIDHEGCAYIVGLTQSPNFPTTPGAFDTSFNDEFENSFITKLNSSGSAIVYSTFLGGSGQDVIQDIAVDAGGCAYVTGVTQSSDFPTTPGAFDNITYLGYEDSFVTKLNSSGSALEYSTLLGGSEGNYALEIEVDNEGCAYICGHTYSADFPTSNDAFDRTYNNHSGSSVFITKLNQTGSEIKYSTFICGSGYNMDLTYGMVVDSAGFAYVVGSTVSSDFPTTPGAFNTNFNNIFISKLYPGMVLIPDLLLKAGNSSYGCNNIYSDDGSSQTVSQNASMNQTVNYAFRVQNDSSFNDSFKITGTAGGDGWSIVYKDLTTNADVTAQVTGDGWASGTLAPGATNGVYVLISPNSTVTPGSEKTLTITAVSQGDTSKKDVGKAVTTAISTYKPDILIKAGNTTYDCNNIYGTDGSNQIRTQNASIGQTVSYGFRVQNDGNTSDTFKITGPAGGSGWTVRYYDLTTNADVTSQVTGSGWSSGFLAPGATNGVYAKVTPDNTVVSGSVKTLQITAVSQGDTSKKDVCRAVTTTVAAYRTDILMKAGAEVSYAFNNIYSTDGSSQTKMLNASTNQRVNYGFRVQNDGINSDTFKITGPGSSSGWTIVYRDLTTNADVTAQVTGSGWTSGALIPGATNGVYVFVTPDGTVPVGSEKILTITAISQNDASTKDICKAVTRKL